MIGKRLQLSPPIPLPRPHLHRVKVPSFGVRGRDAWTRCVDAVRVVLPLRGLRQQSWDSVPTTRTGTARCGARERPGTARHSGSRWTGLGWQSRGVLSSLLRRMGGSSGRGRGGEVREAERRARAERRRSPGPEEPETESIPLHGSCVAWLCAAVCVDLAVARQELLHYPEHLLRPFLCFGKHGGVCSENIWETTRGETGSSNSSRI